VAGETGLIDIEARGSRIKVFLAGTIKAPGTESREFRECIGYCSPAHTKLEERVDISVADDEDPLASLPTD
jgi:hypothetical protein